MLALSIGALAVLGSGALGAGAYASGELGPRVTVRNGAPNLAIAMVEAHDQVRARLGLSPVTWDPELARHAQTYADQLISGPGLRHSPHESRPGEGENLARVDGGRMGATALFTLWADEGAQYSPAPLDCGDHAGLSRTGHYTQIVWKGAPRIGCAIADAADSEVLACRYSPPGNVCGQAPY